MIKINKNEIMFLIKPISFLFIVILLTIALIFIGFRQIVSVKSKIDESKKVEQELNQKISVLQKVTEIVSEDSLFLDIVIPNKSALLFGLNQIKSQAAQNSLLVSDIRTNAPVLLENNISSNSIIFEVQGDEGSIFNFLKSMSKVLPIMRIKNIKVDHSSTNIRAIIEMNVYSTELPKTIPSITSATTDLTDVEMNLIKELSGYSLPTFSEPKVEESTGKEDPFN